jgi:hypothetical protein
MWSQSVEDAIVLLHVPVADRMDVDLLVWLERTTEFIMKALDGGGVVLVHCIMVRLSASYNDKHCLIPVPSLAGDEVRLNLHVMRLT